MGRCDATEARLPEIVADWAPRVCLHEIRRFFGIIQRVIHFENALVILDVHPRTPL